jgi:hypothetical protein
MRVGLWWSIVVTCVAAFLFSSSLPERAVIAASIVLFAALICCALEHGWFKAPVAIGTIPRALLIVAVIGCVVGMLFSYTWPSKSIVYIIPGPVLNPDSQNPIQMFLVVVRGSQAVYNVSASIEDLQKREQIRRDMNAAQSDAERNKIASEWSPLRLHYEELDPSTISGTDREVGMFEVPTGLQRDMRYEMVISFRGVDERETLELRSPKDHVDWQYKTKVVWKQDVVIDCEDPRFSQDRTEAAEGKLPGCSPDYQGRLPH